MIGWNPNCFANEKFNIFKTEFLILTTCQPTYLNLTSNTTPSFQLHRAELEILFYSSLYFIFGIQSINKSRGFCLENVISVCLLLIIISAATQDHGAFLRFMAYFNGLLIRLSILTTSIQSSCPSCSTCTQAIFLMTSEIEILSGPYSDHVSSRPKPCHVIIPLAVKATSLEWCNGQVWLDPDDLLGLTFHYPLFPHFIGFQLLTWLISTSLVFYKYI